MTETDKPEEFDQYSVLLGRVDFLQGQIEGVQSVLCEAMRGATPELQTRVQGALRERIRWMKEGDPGENPPGVTAGVETVLNGLVQMFHADESAGTAH